MPRHLFNIRANDNRLILAVLALALVFISAHFVLHDLDGSSGNLSVQDECQVCRLTHFPVASNAGLFLFGPLRAIAYLLPTETVWRPETLRVPALGARAPPLS